AQAKEILRAHDATGMEWTHAMVGAMEDISSRVLDVGQARALTAVMLQPRLAPGPSILQFARRHQLLPEAYIYGCAHVWKFWRGRSSFLNGRISDTGWRAFFPYAFAIKTPLGSFAVIALALGAFFSRAGLRPPLFAVLPWITLM